MCCLLAAELTKKIHQEEKACYKAVQLSEEGPSAVEGQGQGSGLLVLAQNCAVMHNLLGPACIFLRKGFAENRQPVCKSQQHPLGTGCPQGAQNRLRPGLEGAAPRPPETSPPPLPGPSHARGDSRAPNTP